MKELTDDEENRLFSKLDSIFLKFTKEFDSSEPRETSYYYDKKIKAYTYGLIVYYIEGLEFWNLIHKYGLKIYCIAEGQFNVVVDLLVTRKTINKIM